MEGTTSLEKMMPATAVKLALVHVAPNLNFISKAMFTSHDVPSQHECELFLKGEVPNIPSADPTILPKTCLRFASMKILISVLKKQKNLTTKLKYISLTFQLPISFLIT